MSDNIIVRYKHGELLRQSSIDHYKEVCVGLMPGMSAGGQSRFCVCT